MSTNKRPQLPKGVRSNALKRLFGMIIKDYPGFFLLVVAAILIVAFAWYESKFKSGVISVIVAKLFKSFEIFSKVI